MQLNCGRQIGSNRNAVDFQKTGSELLVQNFDLLVHLDKLRTLSQGNRTTNNADDSKLWTLEVHT